MELTTKLELMQKHFGIWHGGIIVEPHGAPLRCRFVSQIECRKCRQCRIGLNSFLSSEAIEDYECVFMAAIFKWENGTTSARFSSSNI